MVAHHCIPIVRKAVFITETMLFFYQYAGFYSGFYSPSVSCPQVAAFMNIFSSQCFARYPGMPRIFNLDLTGRIYNFPRFFTDNNMKNNFLFIVRALPVLNFIEPLKILFSASPSHFGQQAHQCIIIRKFCKFWKI